MLYVEGFPLAGWGVVRNAPWHFAGVLTSKAEGDAKTAELGSDYEARWGENREGTDDFIWTGQG